MTLEVASNLLSIAILAVLTRWLWKEFNVKDVFRE